KGNKDDAELLAVADAVLPSLAAGVPARRSGVAVPPELGLLSAKPVIFVCNVAEADVVTGNAMVDKVRHVAEAEGADVIVISARIEEELAQLDPDEAA